MTNKIKIEISFTDLKEIIDNTSNPRLASSIIDGQRLPLTNAAKLSQIYDRQCELISVDQWKNEVTYRYKEVKWYENPNLTGHYRYYRNEQSKYPQLTDEYSRATTSLEDWQDNKVDKFADIYSRYFEEQTISQTEI